MVIITEVEARKRVQENDEKIRKNLEANQEMERRNKGMIRDRIRTELEVEEMKKRDEIREETEKNFELVEEKMKEIVEKRRENESKLLEMGQKLEDENEKKLEEMRKENEEKIEKSENVLEEKTNKLGETKKAIVQQVHEMNDIREKGINARNTIRDAHAKRQNEEDEKQRKLIEELEKEKSESEIGHQTELRQLAETDRERQTKLTDQLTLLDNNKTHRSIGIIEAVSAENKFDNFRNECRNVVNGLTKVKYAFNNEENTIEIAIKYMSNLLDVENHPDMESVNTAAKKVITFLNKLEVPEQKYKDLAENVEEKIMKFKKHINDIDTNITFYSKQYKKGVLPSDEQLKRDVADLKILYENAQKLLGELTKLFAEFKIPACQTVQKALNDQMKSLKLGVDQLKIDQE